MLKIPSDVQQRTHYLNKVLPFMGKNIIKVFTGQRRVGKSYLLYHIILMLKAKNADVPIIYINTLNPQVKNLHSKINFLRGKFGYFSKN